jgi:3-phenylpropionate/trans-cinnamate dioxygenase ferredoxin reductase subunit
MILLNYKYLLVGGGMSADSAIQAIRKVDPIGTIGVICKEDHSPYDRPPLSHSLWFGGDVDDIWRNTGNLGAILHLSRTATSLFPDKRILYDHEGQIYSYEKLLIATGSTPRQLESSTNDIVYLRGLDDYFKLRTLVEKHEHFCVVGGGFIGTEIAAALASQRKYVTMVFPEKGPLASILPMTISKHLHAAMASKGISMVADELVTGAEKIGREIEIKTNRGTMLAFDGVVAGMGSIPETALASTGDLRLNGSGGILVDDRLRASKPGVYAAGDVASFPSKALGSVMRYCHADNANAMGAAAGANMAGGGVAYDHLPVYSSAIFGMQYLTVGDVSARYNYVIDWKDEPASCTVYYLVSGRVRGILFWNLSGDIAAARALIIEGKSHNVHTLKGLLP